MQQSSNSDISQPAAMKSCCLDVSVMHALGDLCSNSIHCDRSRYGCFYSLLYAKRVEFHSIFSTARHSGSLCIKHTINLRWREGGGGGGGR